MDMAADLWLPALSPFGGFHHFLCDNSSYTLLLCISRCRHTPVSRKMCRKWPKLQIALLQTYQRTQGNEMLVKHCFT